MLINVLRRRAVIMCSGAVAVLSLSLAGCGDSESSSASSSASSSSSSSSSAETESTPTAEETPLTPVSIGIDPTTMPYAGKKGDQLIGMDYDVAQVLAKQANLEPDIQELTFDNAVPALKAGRVDVSFVGGWYDSPERRAEMNIITYYSAAVGFVTSASGETVGDTWEGRCGLTLATYASSPSYLEILNGDSAKCTDAGKAEIKVDTYAGLAQGVLAVRSGRADGFLDAVPAVAYQAQANSGLSYVEATDQPAVNWGIAVSKDETELAQTLAEAVDAARQSGELAKVWTKYGLPESMNLGEVTLNGNPV